MNAEGSNREKGEASSKIVEREHGTQQHAGKGGQVDR